ncbi:MAG: hypothetical protein J6J24_04495 [Clostridia bacterium]|nr:hypothetical protein [Clostridia bacterium]
MKRVMTLIGFIISTSLLGLYTLIQLVCVAAIIDHFSATGIQGGATLAVIFLITLALCIVTLVFNAIAISAWKKDPLGYKKKKGIVITATVFNFITILFLIIGMFSGAVGVLDILLLFALIATNVLAYVDMGIEKKRVALNKPVERDEITAE